MNPSHQIVFLLGLMSVVVTFAGTPDNIADIQEKMMVGFILLFAIDIIAITVKYTPRIVGAVVMWKKRHKDINTTYNYTLHNKGDNP